MRRMRLASAALLAALEGAGCGNAPVAPASPVATHVEGRSSVATDAAAPSEPTPLGPLPPDVHPTHQSIAVDLTREDALSGTVTIDVTLDHPRSVIWLHGRGLTVERASAAKGGAPGDEITASWAEVDPIGVARLSFPRPLGPGKVTLRIAYRAPYDPQLAGAYRSKGAVFTKFEAIYARRAYPCFDEPAFKIPFDVSLVVPARDTAIGNMPIAAEEARADGTKRVRFATTPPLPTYLVAFASGPLESRAAAVPPTDLRTAPLPLGAWAMRGRADETAFALRETPALVAAEERYFGVTFPFPKLDLIAVPDFQSSAMENAGAIAFKDRELLVDAEHAPFDRRVRVVDTIAHEVAHQWFGDLVTMRWWDDLWLNEGFATLIADTTVRTVHPEYEPDVARVDRMGALMNADSRSAARRVRQPIETTHDITNAFDDITYG
jgi:alanyl aminopeptidase